MKNKKDNDLMTIDEFLKHFELEVNNLQNKNKVLKDLSKELNDDWQKKVNAVQEALKQINIDDETKIEDNLKELRKLKTNIEIDLDADLSDIKEELIIKQRENKHIIENFILNLENKKLNITIQNLEIKIKEIDTKIELTNNRNNTIDKKYNRLDNKILSTTKKLDGILANVFAIIITFSFVSAATTAIEKLDFKYVPLFLMSCVWMSSMLILLSASVYRFDDIELDNVKKKGSWKFLWINDSNAKLSILLFIAITVVFVAICIYTICI